jgi:hypothetical protein
MSERGQAQSEVTRASLKIGDARGAVQEAIRYLEMYGFLRSANRELLRDLRGDEATLIVMERRLWNAEVETD